MGKRVHDDVLDGALGIVRGHTTKMVACSAEPASFSAANGSLKLAEVAMSAADFSIGNGAASGRRVTVAQKLGVAVTASGTADHVALLDEGAARLLYVTICTPQSLTQGASVNFGSWDVEINDPA